MVEIRGMDSRERVRGERERGFLFGKGRSGDRVKCTRAIGLNLRENLGEIYSTFLVCEIHSSCRDTALPCPYRMLNVLHKHGIRCI